MDYGKYEMDYGKYYSPDPYRNCMMAVNSKIVSGLIDSTGSLKWSRSGLVEIVRSFLLTSLGKDYDKMLAFLVETVPERAVDP